MSDHVICLTTCESQDADRIARAFVEQRLAACVNIITQVSSIYRWKGKIESATESLLIIKTRGELVQRMESTLKGIHPYETPEFVVIDIANGSAEYLSWITASLEQQEEG
ncbi:MAG: divalent-cation tolerance protein CutA [Candidatus Thorarchaeota archaeon]